MSAILAIVIFVCGGALGAAVMRFLAPRNVQNEVLNARYAEATAQNKSLTDKLEASRIEVQQARVQLARVETETRGLQEKIQQHQTDLENMEKKSRESFENLSNKIFDAQATKFNESSKAKLDVLLNPLQKQLEDFQKKVDENVKEQFSLKNEIARIVLTNETMSQQTNNLTNALKGNSKTQGDWGELVLENILEASGLRRDDDYIVQGVDLGMKDEEGRSQRPDVVVRLPEKKHIIIDSKVSLTHYEVFCGAEDDTAKNAALQNYIASVRSHIVGLQTRGYQHNEKLGTPDFVLLFMPTEGAYALAVQQDKDLHTFAWNKKIVMVCPSTLFATLRTVASIWRLELQNKNSEEIAKQAGSLYDKVHGFVEDMLRIGKQIENAGGAYNDAMSKLSTGTGNILRRTENMKKLGAKAQKSLPMELVEGGQLDEEGVVVSLTDKKQAN